MVNVVRRYVRRTLNIRKNRTAKFRLARTHIDLEQQARPPLGPPWLSAGRRPRP